MPQIDPAGQKDFSLKDLITASGMLGLFKMIGDNPGNQNLPPNMPGNPSQQPLPPPNYSSIGQDTIQQPSIHSSMSVRPPPPMPVGPDPSLNPSHYSIPNPMPPMPPNLSMNPPQSQYLMGNTGFPVKPEREPVPLPIDEPRSSFMQSKPFSTDPASGTPTAGPFSTYVLNTLSHFYNVFQNLIKIPKNATNTVYVEGIPFDTSEREVARIF